MPRRSSKLRTCERGHTFRKASDCPVCSKCAAEDKKRLAGEEFPASLAAPALRALGRAGISSLAQLADHTEAEVAKLHGIGPKALAQLKKAMKSDKVSFR